MNRSILDKIRSKVSLKVTGKNSERFIRRLHQHHIEILKLRYPNFKTVEITIYEKDYPTVMELKSVYEIDVIGTGGIIKVKRKIKKNRFFFLALVVGLAALYFLSHVIFSIEIVHTNKEIRNLLMRELEAHGIKEKSIRKNFKELEEIKEDIIEKNRDKIEWLEIETVGTKYVVRVEMRKLEEVKEEGSIRNVVARKSAILRRVDATKGEIIRDTNDYVKAGDVVISGELKLNEETKEQVSAEGTIYGEVWYKVTVSYPFAYREVTETGKKQTAYVIQILNQEIQLFPWNHYQTKKVDAQTLLKHSFLPFSLLKEKQFETREIDEINTEDEAIAKAESLATKKIESQLSDNEKIISQKNLKVEIKESRIELEVFVTVLENITSYQNIEEKIEEIEEDK